MRILRSVLLLMEAPGRNRYRLTDEQWDLVGDLLPPPAKTGRSRSNLRRVIDGILWILRTGAPWRDLPEGEFGLWQTVYGWFRKWTAERRLMVDGE